MFSYQDTTMPFHTSQSLNTQNKETYVLAAIVGKCEHVDKIFQWFSYIDIKDYKVNLIWYLYIEPYFFDLIIYEKIYISSISHIKKRGTAALKRQSIRSIRHDGGVHRVLPFILSYLDL